MTRTVLLLAVIATMTMPTAAPASRILALFAHPDDEVLMAGTLAMAAEAGHRVRVVYATSGDAGQDRSGRGLAGAALAEVREGETRRSNKALGFADAPVFLRHPDGQVFAHRDAVRAGFLAEATAFDPDLVVALGPDGITGHPDHQAAYLAARQVRDRLPRRPGFLAVVFTEARAARFGETWHLQGVKPHAVDRSVEVPMFLRRKRVEVLRLHRTQFPEAMVEEYRSRAMAEDATETFQGDGAIPGVPGLEP